MRFVNGITISIFFMLISPIGQPNNTYKFGFRFSGLQCNIDTHLSECLREGNLELSNTIIKNREVEKIGRAHV